MLRNRKKTSFSSTRTSPQSKISSRSDDSTYDGAKGPHRLFRLIDYAHEYSWQLILLTFILILTACIAIKSHGNGLHKCHQRRQDGIYRDACGCLPHDGFGARIAYLVSLHNARTLDAGLVLLKSISAPSSIIFIHIDTKLSRDEYQMSELKSFIEGECNACGARIVVESKFDLEWGQWSMNDPTHWSKFDLPVFHLNLLVSMTNSFIFEFFSKNGQSQICNLIPIHYFLRCRYAGIDNQSKIFKRVGCIYQPLRRHFASIYTADFIKYI